MKSRTARPHRLAMYDEMAPRRLVILIAASVFFVACSSPGVTQDAEGPRGAAPGFAGREVHQFSSIRDVVRTADFVVLGTVSDVRPGRQEGPPGEEIYFTDAAVDVEEVWHGRGDVAPGDTIVVETLREEGYAVDWHEAGTRVILALSNGPAAAEGRYFTTNTQFSLIVQGEDVIRTQDDPFANKVDSMSRSEVKERVRERP